MSQSTPLLTKPWYREPWCWFVLTPLIAVMFVSATLVSVAYIHSDDRVVDNYYKHGRMINQRLEQDVRALQWNLAATMTLDRQQIQLELTTDTAMPETLSLWLDHPFEESLDHYLLLTRQASGDYHGQLPVSAGHWYLTLAPEQPRDQRSDAPWRLRADLVISGAYTQLQLSPPESR